MAEAPLGFPIRNLVSAGLLVGSIVALASIGLFGSFVSLILGILALALLIGSVVVAEVPLHVKGRESAAALVDTVDRASTNRNGLRRLFLAGANRDRGENYRKLLSIVLANLEYDAGKSSSYDVWRQWSSVDSVKPALDLDRDRILRALNESLKKIDEDVAFVVLETEKYERTKPGRKVDRDDLASLTDDSLLVP